MLFTPYRLGGLALPNRIVMPPMTRSRAASGNVPTALMAEYYAQRASTRPSRSRAGVASPRPCMPLAAASLRSSGTSVASRMSRCNRAVSRPCRLRRWWPMA